MRKLVFTLILFFSLININGQVPDSAFIEMNSVPSSMIGDVDKIILTDSLCNITILSNDQKTSFELLQSKLNSDFIDYLRIGDMLVMKEGKKSVSVIRKADEYVKVKVFYIRTGSIVK